jgi:hypothetical protein
VRLAKVGRTFAVLAYRIGPSPRPMRRFILSSLRRPNMADATTRPFLIQKDTDGNFRLTLRTTRYNSQGYPLVDAALQDEVFKTAAAAKAFARDNFRAQPGEYATK